MAEIALTGIGVSPGVVVGPVARMASPAPLPAAATDQPAGDPGAERDRALGALEAVAVELETRAGWAGGQAAEILNAEALMARDPDLTDEISRRTGRGESAPRAVAQAFAGYRELLAQAGEYMAARVADLDAVRDLALALLAGIELPTVPDPGHPFVLVARDLTPADTATLDPVKVLALVTEEGGPTSHTAILAKAMAVPAVVGCAGATGLDDDTRVIVDGAAGTVLAGPDPDEVAAAERARRQPVARAGVMVELPSAALAARSVLEACDFASLGTNDLAQYASGADRMVGALAPFQDPWQPALLALVAMTAEAGAATGRPVGVCGEAAGDPALALVLTGLGIGSLSMAPASLADVRAVLARHTLAECRALAARALAARDVAGARGVVRQAVGPTLEALGL